jgi:hypothetical protein
MSHRLPWPHVLVTAALLALAGAAAGNGLYPECRRYANVYTQELARYRIVYLIAQGAEPRSSAIAPACLKLALGAREVNTMDELIALDREQPIDALLVHDSMLGAVDRDWLFEAYYHRGLELVVFNAEGPAIADLVQNSAMAQNLEAYGHYSRPYWTRLWTSPHGGALGKTGIRVDGLKAFFATIHIDLTFNLAQP